MRSRLPLPCVLLGLAACGGDAPPAAPALLPREGHARVGYLLPDGTQRQVPDARLLSLLEVTGFVGEASWVFPTQARDDGTFTVQGVPDGATLYVRGPSLVNDPEAGAARFVVTRDPSLDLDVPRALGRPDAPICPTDPQGRIVLATAPVGNAWALVSLDVGATAHFSASFNGPAGLQGAWRLGERDRRCPSAAQGDRSLLLEARTTATPSAGGVVRLWQALRASAPQAVTLNGFETAELSAVLTEPPRAQHTVSRERFLATARALGAHLDAAGGPPVWTVAVHGVHTPTGVVGPALLEHTGALTAADPEAYTWARPLPPEWGDLLSVEVATDTERVGRRAPVDALEGDTPLPALSPPRDLTLTPLFPAQAAPGRTHLQPHVLRWSAPASGRAAWYRVTVATSLTRTSAGALAPAHVAGRFYTRDTTLVLPAGTVADTPYPVEVVAYAADGAPEALSPFALERWPALAWAATRAELRSQ